MAQSAAARGLEDDCAVLEFGGERLVLTHDAMAEGVHFLPADDPRTDMADVAWKLVAVNLSDLAAKGTEPVGILLGYSLGSGNERFIEGLREALDAFGVPLLGGDTISAKGARSLSLTAIGRATYTPVPSRSGAKIGDAVYITGEVGKAMLGLEQFGSGNENDLAYRRPKPLLAEGLALAPVVTAMLDVSDGLLLDCTRLAEASGVTIDLDRTVIPVADPTRADECMRWGDDYQLLFTAPPDVEPPLAVHRIGTVQTMGSVPLLLDSNPPPHPDQLGYEHR